MGILGVGWFVLVWRVERYVVTTRRVIEVGGVINKYAKDTSLPMITDMIVGHPWLGRIVGYGEVDLLTASEAGTTKIRFLPDADDFKKTLLDARHEYEIELGGGRAQAAPAAAPAAPAPAPTSAEDVDESLTRLADMRDRGLITPAEFDEKKPSSSTGCSSGSRRRNRLGGAARSGRGPLRRAQSGVEAPALRARPGHARREHALDHPHAAVPAHDPPRRGRDARGCRRTRVSRFPR